MRATLLVLVAVLAWLGVGEARAQEPAICSSYDENCSRAEALAACQTWVQWKLSNGHNYLVNNCGHNPVSANRGRYLGQTCSGNAGGCQAGTHHSRSHYYDYQCPVGTEWNEDTQSCGLPCDGKSPISAGSAHAPGDSDKFCSEGCAYTCSSASLLLTVDGQTRTVCAGPWTTSGQATCSVQDMPAPIAAVTDSDGDGTSDGNDASPNNPGSGGGGPEDASDTGNPDAPGSGNGNTSGGGGDCNTPPRSTGDAILAQIAFQTWATRCTIVGNANAGTGTGEGAGDGPGTGGEFDGDAEGESAAMHGSDGDPVRADVVDEAPGPEEGELDTSGYGYSRACVTSPTVTVFGQTITLDTGPMCQWLELGSWFVLVLAGLASARIIGGGMA